MCLINAYNILYLPNYKAMQVLENSESKIESFALDSRELFFFFLAELHVIALFLLFLTTQSSMSHLSIRHSPIAKTVFPCIGAPRTSLSSRTDRRGPLKGFESTIFLVRRQFNKVQTTPSQMKTSFSSPEKPGQYYSLPSGSPKTLPLPQEL